jgi:hypothetical protein
MSARLHIKIATAIAAVAVIATATAPYASAAPPKGTRVGIPANLANFREPGSTGYVPKTTDIVTPPWLWLGNLRKPGSTVPAASVVTVSSPAGGFEWVSALIGAGAALGLALAGAGAFVMVRKRRSLAHA